MGGAVEYLLLSDLTAISNEAKKKHPQLRDVRCAGEDKAENVFLEREHKIIPLLMYRRVRN